MSTDNLSSAYLAPLAKTLLPLTNLSFSSQILYHSRLPLPPLKSTGLSDEPFHFFRAEHLPHFVNTAEWNLASVADSGQPIHLLLYVPRREEHPLYILDAGKQPVETNAWLVPAWGGSAVSNLPLDRTNGTGAFHFTRQDLKPIMEVYVAQLRELLGIVPALPELDFLAAPASLPRVPLVAAATDPSRGVTDWEIDRALRMRTARNVLDAARSLVSLGRLVGGMSNMVVPDRIGDKVMSALDALRGCLEAVAEGRLDEGVSKVKEGVGDGRGGIF